MDEKCLRRSPRLSSSLVGPGSSKPVFSCSESSDSFEKRPCKKIVLPTSENRHGQYKRTSFFIGDPVPDKEAQERWHWRYDLKVEHNYFFFRGRKTQKCKAHLSYVFILRFSFLFLFLI
ncbi:unnamed protein product, partial [Vitis vinifera]